jgi:demethylmenaquinone methyltransferase / 2-methoxy-6-polyprenyl-1,4-benzoquinol methylase
MPPDSSTIRDMFNNISGQYDFLNHFLSFGVDRRWRKRVVTELAKHAGTATAGLKVLDVATGTGDLAIAVSSLNPASVAGIDIAPAMMEIGRDKVFMRGLQDVISFSEAAAEKIPFPDSTFDAVTVAFGVRNFGDLVQGISEMQRVLKPGGIMLILEFSHPRSFPSKQLYNLYSRFIIPTVGRIVSKNREAYSYLPESVAAFPSGTDFMAIMEGCGLKSVRQIPLTMGVASVYTGEK